MPLRDFELAAQIIQSHPELMNMSGPVLPTTIAQAEQLLGVTFPTSYRCFLALFGYLSFGIFEIDGLFEGRLDAFGAGNVVWQAREDRKLGLAEQFVPIYDLGDGTEYYLDTSRVDAAGECPVVAMHGGVPFSTRGGLSRCAPDFGAFLLELVRESLALESDG